MPETKVVQIPDYRFSSTDWPIVRLVVNVATLASRFGFSIDHWQEGGLGSASGMLLSLASGRVVLLRELEHAVRYLGAKGPTIHVEASHLAQYGVEPLVNEVLDALELSRDATDWIAPVEAQAGAADLLARLAEYVAKRDRATGGEPFK
jgi:hypothetical protein